MEKNTGKLIALAAAGLFLSGGALAVTTNAYAHDSGTCTVKNSCKGKGSCGVPGKNDCTGKNACKGQGWVYIQSGGKKVEMSKAECEAIDGATFKSHHEDEKKS